MKCDNDYSLKFNKILLLWICICMVYIFNLNNIEKKSLLYLKNNYQIKKYHSLPLMNLKLSNNNDNVNYNKNKNNYSDNAVV